MTQPYQFGVPQPAQGWNLQSYMQGLPALSAPAATPNVPYSPVADPGVRDYLSQTTSGTSAPNWRNPYAWQSWDASSGLGDFLGANAPLLLGGLQTLSGGIQAYTGLKGVSLAQKALQQEKKAFNINLTNQTQSYNTQVGDRIAGRSYASEAERQAALAAAQLVDRSKYGKGG